VLKKVADVHLLHYFGGVTRSGGRSKKFNNIEGFRPKKGPGRFPNFSDAPSIFYLKI
jgi:hypothetical protein